MTDEAAQPRDADQSRGPASSAPPSPPSPADSDEPTAAVPANEPPAADEPPTAAVPADEPPTAAVPANEPPAADEPPTEPLDVPTAATPQPDPTLIDEPPTTPFAAPAGAGQAPPPPPPGAGQAPPPPPGAGQPPPPPGAGQAPPPPPPGAGQVPPNAPPPWFGAADGPSFSREKLVRPTQGRYVAGVCGAIGRATNTDPVLWRVLLAVLGFFGGVGVLIYLIGWLAIPGETDTASPIESLLGRGRSGMKPLSIVLLGGAAVLTFAFVVNDGFRAALLAAAVLIGAALLLKRGGTSAPAPAAGFPPPPAGDPAGAFTSTAPAASGPAAGMAGGPATATAPSAHPMTPPADSPLPPSPPPFGAPPSGTAAFGAVPPAAPGPPQFAPPTGGYRPPFAPHGPWAGASQQPYTAPQPPRAPKPPKPPRERSKLGRITFFGLIMVMGLMAVLDMAGLSVPVSAYFAAALTTIAFGLIVGAWFGRARGLIALAVVATIGLGISSGLERFGGEVGNNVFRPTSLAGVADRYDFTIGNATLDLRRVDFTDEAQETTVQMKVGQIKVLLPPNVDTTADVRMSDGRAMIFGREWNGQDLSAQAVTDLGRDGTGGGTLKLIVEMNAGNVEVSR
jgi:phage shock protein PspC (stress-responsive transcriptional regulator)